MEYIDHQKGNFVRDDNGQVKWEPDENGQFTMINEPGFRRIDLMPQIDPEVGKPIEDRSSFTDTYIMTRNEAYKLATRLPGADLKKYKRLLLGTRRQRFVRWFKGLFSYLRIDWRARK